MITTILLSVFLVFAAVGIVTAQEGAAPATPIDTSTAATNPSTSAGASALTPPQSSGQTFLPQLPRVIQNQNQTGSGVFQSNSGQVGDEVSRLQREMEDKIKTIRAEYKIKIDAARKAAQAVRQNVKQNVRQNVKQNVRQNIQQNVRQNTRENVRQSINGLLQQGGQPSGGQGLQGIQGQGPLGPQQNPIGPTQEQLGPPPSGGGSQPAPFSSSVLQKFLPSYSW